jgi:hypothetical protein
MKLWLLRPLDVDDLPDGENPWDPWYDKAFGFVVRASNEDEARKFAHADAGCENRGEFMQKEIAKTTEPWLDAKYTTCVPLSDDGESGVVLKDYHSA